MKRYVRTPSGLLGLITLALVVAFSVSILFALRTVNEATQRTECIAKELAVPWVGLKESFNAPPGDPAARARALAAISKGIVRLEHLDQHC